MNEIIAEHNHGKTPHQDAIDWFRERGVTALQLARGDDGLMSFVLLDDVVFLPGGFSLFPRP